MKDVFAARKVGADQLPAVSATLLPINEASEAQREKSVQEQFGSAFPGVAQYTTDVLFRDLWLRPDLSPRDRSLVTVGALIANGQTAQLTPHLNRAMDNGLTQPEASVNRAFRTACAASKIRTIDTTCSGDSTAARFPTLGRQGSEHQMCPTEVRD